MSAGENFFSSQVARLARSMQIQDLSSGKSQKSNKNENSANVPRSELFQKSDKPAVINFPVGENSEKTPENKKDEEEEVKGDAVEDDDLL